MNLPNALTISRIFLIPLLLAVLLPRNLTPHTELWASKELWASAIVLVAAATDILDGYLARRRHQITTLGMLLDPVADKLLVSAAFISLVELGQVPAWMAVIIIGREFVVSGLRSIAASQGFTIQASELGKAKMVSQIIAVILKLMGMRYAALGRLGEIAVWVVVLFAVASMMGYFWRFWRKIDRSIKEARRARLRLLRRRKKQNAASEWGSAGS